MKKIFKGLILALGILSMTSSFAFAGWNDFASGSDIDLLGKDILNVSQIYGNGTYIGFGGEVTSHSLSDDGDIVVRRFECNSRAWFDENVYFQDNNVSILNTRFSLKDNIEGVVGDGLDFCHGYDSGDDVWSFGTGDNCETVANRAMYINKSTDVVIVNDLTVTGEIIGGAKSYAEMYRCCYNTASTIDTADVWHMVSTTTVGLLNNWTHEVGDTAAITAYADGGGGLVTVTSAGHGMSAGNMISITGSTNYNALEEVVGVHTNTFTVTATWAGDDGAGTWIKGDSLTAVANSAGVYAVNFTATLTPSVNNEIFSFAFSKNATECEKCRVRSKMGIVGDYKPAPGTALVTIAEGDVLNFIIKNIGANGNVTIRHGNINLHRL